MVGDVLGLEALDGGEDLLGSGLSEKIEDLRLAETRTDGGNSDVVVL